MSDRYKLVLSPEDEPWLFDLEQDPDELKNYYREATHQAVVRKLAQALRDYGPRHADPYLRHPKLVAELAAALQE